MSSTPPATDPKLYVIALRCGQLANRLVLFANLIALAEETGGRVSNVAFHSYAAHFKTTRRDIYCRYPVAKRRSIFDLLPGAARFIRKVRIFYQGTRAIAALHRQHGILGRRTVFVAEQPGQDVIIMEGRQFQELVKNARRVFIYGWSFRAPDCVQRHAEKIRAYFQPVDEIEKIAREVPDRLRHQADIVVGVHIRQGDYRNFRNGRFFFPVARYAEWMREMTAEFPGRKVAFFVCSDEPRRAEEFDGLVVGFGGTSAMTDLYGLAKCDYIFGPVSTFSQWAAFYGNKPLLHFYDAASRLELKNFRATWLREIP